MTSMQAGVAGGENSAQESSSMTRTFPDYSYSRDPELLQLAKQVRDDLDDVDNWGRLVDAAQAQEGGLNRNSNPQAISSTRETFDFLLARFPLFFGFWKKYADLEFTIGGPEAAEMIYERGVASVGTSVDLWTNYCAFKVETSHEPEIIRVLFERAVECAGLDFLAHPLWDKYLEYEERLEAPERVFAILDRIIHIPLHQYARYFEKYCLVAQRRPVEELGPDAAIEGIKASVARENAQRAIKPADLEREVRTRCGVLHRQIFERTQAETTKRWVFEQEIRRPYFHVSDLDEPQLQNWRKYLDFEESECQHARIRFLYERCLVTTAMYEEFWLRYARWILGQSVIEKYIRSEEVRYVYRRACCYFVPVSSPAVRLNYARFEESIGNPESAIDILEDVLRVMPGNVETTLAIVNTHRRSSGVDTAIEVLSRHISETTDVHVRSALIVEKTRLVWRVKGDAVRARAIFQDHHSQALDSRKFWIGWFDFEAAQPTSEADEASNFERIKHVYELSRRVAQLPAEVGQELSSMYFQYLEERGGKNAMEEFIELDRVVNGPVGANRQAENNILPDGKSATQHAVAGVNGTSGGAKAAESGIPRTANPVSVPIGGYGMNGS